MYEYRYNTALKQVEYRKKGTNKYQPLGERDYLLITKQVRNHLPHVSPKMIKEALLGDDSFDTDPFKEYFELLPEWDRADRLKEFATTVNTVDSNFWFTILVKYLCAVVKSLIDEEFTNQHVLVLIGGQGVGKSTWLKKLVPDALKQYVHHGPIDPRNKDDVRKLSECMFINLDELDALGRSNAARIKELITRPEINQRKAYGQMNELYTRRASFVASLNSYQFLHDQTGSRRFLCFKVHHINFQHQVEMDKVYAQIYNMLKQGYDPVLTHEETRRIEQQNENYIYQSPIETAVYDTFEIGSDGDKFYTATDVAETIKRQIKETRVSRSTVTKVGMALSKKFPFARKGNSKGYYLRKRYE